MKFKKSMFCLLSVSVFALPFVAACGTTTSSSAAAASSTETTTSSAAASSAAASSSEAAPSSSAEAAWTWPKSGLTVDDLSANVPIDISCYYDDNTRFMTFTQAGLNKLNGKPTSYTDPAGNQFKLGDWKPVWKQVWTNLNITPTDHSAASAALGNVGTSFTSLRDLSFKEDGVGLNILQGNLSDMQEEGTTNGTLLDLHQYMDVMPNFRKYLQENPSIRKTIQDPNGAIYYAPYFDGFDDVENMMMVRADWVEKLLDGDYNEANFNDDRALPTSAYKRYCAESLDQDIDILKDDGTKGTVHKKYAKNQDIITIQNALTAKTGKTMVKALRDYIDTTYSNAYGTKRSDLFCGKNAAYNVDELVALFRAVYTNGTYLSNQSAKEVVPFYPRQSTNDRTTNLWRFLSQFGCRGVESRQTYLYMGSDGKIQDIRQSQDLVDAVTALNELYQEHLILQDFTNTAATSGGKGDYRTDLANTNMGFATYDYSQTTAAMYYNKITGGTVGSVYPDFKLVPIFPATADWRKDGKEIHYTESWRSVKTNGWCITAKTAEDTARLKRCLYLFDYFWGDEGDNLMSFGTDAYLDHESDGKTVKKITYQGKEYPKLSQATLDQLLNLAGYNYTNFYRYIVGGTFPVGYIKAQAMEYQTNAPVSLPYLDNLETALKVDVVQHPNFNTDNTDHLYDIVPTTFSYTSAEQTAVSNNFTNLGSSFATEKGKNNILTDIVEKGWATAGGTNFSDGATFLTWVKSTLKDVAYLVIANQAYKRMGL
jgi:hypothetical protein